MRLKSSEQKEQPILLKTFRPSTGAIMNFTFEKKAFHLFYPELRYKVLKCAKFQLKVNCFFLLSCGIQDSHNLKVKGLREKKDSTKKV